MKNLNSISTSAFYNCRINEFDALKLSSITDEIDDFISENCTFTVGKKNF